MGRGGVPTGLAERRPALGFRAAGGFKPLPGSARTPSNVGLFFQLGCSLPVLAGLQRRQLPAAACQPSLQRGVRGVSPRLKKEFN